MGVVLFYHIRAYRGQYEAKIALAADQIIERLVGEFSEAERLSYSLKHNEEVKDLVREQDHRAFYSLVRTMEAPTDSGLENHDFINSVVLFGADHHSCRLVGTQ